MDYDLIILINILRNINLKSILVEPIKEYFNELKKNYKNCEYIFFENIAISTNEQINYLYKVNSKDLINTMTIYLELLLLI